MDIDRILVFFILLNVCNMEDDSLPFAVNAAHEILLFHYDFNLIVGIFPGGLLSLASVLIIKLDYLPEFLATISPSYISDLIILH